MNEGELGILNVGAGDTKISFDPANEEERKRAAAIVKDMLKLGYIVMVEVGKDDKGRPEYQRIRKFDDEKCEYIIGEKDPKKPKQIREKRIPAAKTRAVAVPRTAGG